MQQTMKKAILMPIRKRHCDNILAGKKTFELRRTQPAMPRRYDIYLYESGRDGSSAIVGKCRLKYSLPCRVGENPMPGDVSHEAFWIMLKTYSCLTYEEIVQYAAGKQFYAWRLDDAVSVAAPVKLAKIGISRAPQSWIYLSDKQVRKLNTIEKS